MNEASTRPSSNGPDTLGVMTRPMKQNFVNSESATFPESSEIIRRIKAACANRSVDVASIAIAHPNGRQLFAVDKSGDAKHMPLGDQLYVGTTCMVKLYTATVAIQQFLERGISMDTSAEELGRDLFGPSSTGVLRGIRLRDLLNSSHGLDDIRADRFPATSDGYIDYAGLCERFSAGPRLLDPGRAFSYSEAGMLFAGAFLEKLSGRKFGELLKDLFAKIADANARPPRNAFDGARCCPTTGSGFRTSSDDLLDLAALYFTGPGKMHPDAERFTTTMQSNSVAFPGWTSMGTRVGLGWHEYPGGWWGYNGAIADGGWQLLRMSPEKGMAIAIVSKKLPAHFIAMNVFNELLPEMKELRPPRILTPAEQADALKKPEDFTGRYEVAMIAAEIRSAVNSLTVHIRGRFENSQVPIEPMTRQLRLAEARSFFLMPAASSSLVFGQILDVGPSSDVRRVLWNGRRIWRHVATDNGKQGAIGGPSS